MNYPSFLFLRCQKLILILMSLLIFGCAPLTCTVPCGKPYIEISNLTFTKVAKVRDRFVIVHFTFESNVDLDEAQESYGSAVISLAESNRFISSRDGRISAGINLISNLKSRIEKLPPKTIQNILPNGRYLYTGSFGAGDNATLNRLKKLIAEDGGITFHIMMHHSFSADHFGGSFLKLSLEQLGIE